MQWLEPDEGKLSRPVLRGGGGGNAASLPDQTLETKCRFISQVMTGDATMRRAEDVDAAALSYAEVKAIASGNPLVIEKAQVDAEVMRLTRFKKQHAESLYQMRYRLKGLGDSTRGENFSMTVQKEIFTDRVKAGRALVFLAAAMKPFQSTKAICEIGGFPVSPHRFDEKAKLIIHGKCEYKANVSDSAAGTIASVEHALESMEDRLRERESDLKQAHKQTEDLTKQLDHPFEHEEKLTVAAKRQQEIINALDVTKNQAPATVTDSPDESAEAVEEKSTQMAAKKMGRKKARPVTV